MGWSYFTIENEHSRAITQNIVTQPYKPSNVSHLPGGWKVQRRREYLVPLHTEFASNLRDSLLRLQGRGLLLSLIPQENRQHTATFDSAKIFPVPAEPGSNSDNKLQRLPLGMDNGQQVGTPTLYFFCWNMVKVQSVASGQVKWNSPRKISFLKMNCLIISTPQLGAGIRKSPNAQNYLLHQLRAKNCAILKALNEKHQWPFSVHFELSLFLFLWLDLFLKEISIDPTFWRFTAAVSTVRTGATTWP